jgi:hypothetical protein
VARGVGREGPAETVPRGKFYGALFVDDCIRCGPARRCERSFGVRSAEHCHAPIFIASAASVKVLPDGSPNPKDPRGQPGCREDRRQGIGQIQIGSRPDVRARVCEPPCASPRVRALMCEPSYASPLQSSSAHEHARHCLRWPRSGAARWRQPSLEDPMELQSVRMVSVRTKHEKCRIS